MVSNLDGGQRWYGCGDRRGVRVRQAPLFVHSLTSLWLARSFARPLAGSRLVRLSVKLRIDGGVDEDRDGDGDDDTLV